uniref:Uncharacterized protein n=1 Tax=Aegilops tauschii subsp. strangulata TaxID=200361 RepID=A0A453M2F8_AEGTS
GNKSQEHNRRKEQPTPVPPISKQQESTPPPRPARPSLRPSTVTAPAITD